MPKPLSKPLCRHCGMKNAVRPRRLCHGCYDYIPVRDLYPSDYRYLAKHPSSVNAKGFCNDGRKPPPHPTTALPGTPEKIAVMTERLLQGYHLHHPLDPRLSATLMEVLGYVG